MTPVTIHVVVLNYNGADDTIACVGSLRQVRDQRVEIVLVDNASTDGSAAALRSAFPDLTLLESPTNTGYAGGNNLGIRHAMDHGATHILVMNNDVTVTPTFLTPMLNLLVQDPSMGVATCMVFYADDHRKIFSGAGHFSRWLCTGMNKGSYLGRHVANGKEGYATFIPGVLFLARREVFESVGLFDDRYFMYFEDVEFSRRVAAKFRIGYTPDGVAYHRSGGGTAIGNYTSLYNYYHTRNRLLTFSRDSWFYRSYVVGFSLLNITMKSLIQMVTAGSGLAATLLRVGSLWKGFGDGVAMMRAEAGPQG